MLFCPLDPADPTDVDRAAAFPADGPVPGIGADRFRADLVAHRYRPEWTWVAEDAEGRLLARALWWGGPEDRLPRVLDCLGVAEGVRDPEGVATGLLEAAHAVHRAAGADRPPLYNLLGLPADWRERPETAAGVAWRRAAARRVGLTDEVERLRLERPAGAPLPPAPARLSFREASDEEFLAVFKRLAVGTLDVRTRRELAVEGADAQARADMRFYLEAPGERSWWRLAHLPDGTLAGLAVPSRTPYHRNVGYLGVLPELRGQGLIDEVLAWITRFHAAAEDGPLTATTDTVNTPMAAAFARGGYAVSEIRLIMEPAPF
ncbi:GNAT family N-acetyltransferase [Streptomyces sp. NPDC097619]|uniref:GNAT family N-acetyltransferase n=1 Tax=Streptomyces sp. NPDC097619 TaxID=3157228 RepID=UPI0033332765